MCQGRMFDLLLDIRKQNFIFLSFHSIRTLMMILNIVYIWSGSPFFETLARVTRFIYLKILNVTLYLKLTFSVIKLYVYHSICNLLSFPVSSSKDNTKGS